jgi:hypothetical protein
LSKLDDFHGTLYEGHASGGHLGVTLLNSSLKFIYVINREDKHQSMSIEEIRGKYETNI